MFGLDYHDAGLIPMKTEAIHVDSLYLPACPMCPLYQHFHWQLRNQGTVFSFQGLFFFLPWKTHETSNMTLTVFFGFNMFINLKNVAVIHDYLW